MDLISEFDFEIRHIKGKENKVAYTLILSVQIVHLAATSIGEFGIQ
jgi:hypothetical protein